MNSIDRFLISILLLLFFLTSCQKEEQVILPSISTSSISSITSVSSITGGNATSDGGGAITARGVVWNTSPSPTISLSTKTLDGVGVGNFTSNLAGLSPATKYFVRAYATNSSGTSYGSELNFTTLANLPAVVTTSISNISSSSAQAGGSISNDGGSTITARGIVWSTAASPTISLTTKTVDGTGTGNFLSVINGLSPITKYFVRAYASNAAGTAYGDEVTFTTTASGTHDSNKTIIPLGGNSWTKGGAIVKIEGLTNWINSSDVTKTYFRLAQPGNLKLSLFINTNGGTSTIKATIAGVSKEISVSSTLEQEFFIGEWSVAAAGYITLELQGSTKTKNEYGIASKWAISGAAVNASAVFVPDNTGSAFYWSQRGPSLSINHDLTGTNNIEWYYSEINVPANNDVPGSYYMANGFGEGYFGFQVISPTEKWILFSVWSPFVTDNPANIPPEDRVLLVRKGTNVTVDEFGNEGSGGKSYLKYNWKVNTTYKFLVQGKPIENNYTQYTAWFYATDESKWLLIASWKRPKTSTYLKNLYSFLENFYPEAGEQARSANYGNQWVKETTGTWKELTKATITGDHTAAVWRKDYYGGLQNGLYNLKICGFFSPPSLLGQSHSRIVVGVAPVIDFSTLP